MSDDGPAAGYLRLAERIKEFIRSQGLKVGDRLPERSKLQEQFGGTVGMTRQAVDHLKYEGIIQGEQGVAGYKIVRLPGEADTMSADQVALRRLVGALRDEVRRLAEEVAELRRELRGRRA